MKKLLSVLLATAMLLGAGMLTIGATAADSLDAAVPEEINVGSAPAGPELTWMQASSAAERGAAERGAADVAFGWEEYAEFFSYPVWILLQTSFAPFCLKDVGQANAVYGQFTALQAEWRGRITSESALSDYLKALGNIVKPAMTKDGQEIFNAYLPDYALVRLVEKAGGFYYAILSESDEMKALAGEMGVEMWQLDQIDTYNAGNIGKLKQYFANVAIVATRYLKAQGVEFPGVLDNLVERAEYYDAVVLKLWGREVIMKHWYDWVLLVVCFGWIWMAFI